MKALSILANWVLSAITIFIIANYVPGFEVDSFQTALIIAVILGITNAFIKPVLVILTLPITIVTLGLFVFVLNALLIWAVAYVVEGFNITGFVPALVGAVALWLVNTLLNFIVFPVRAVK